MDSQDESCTVFEPKDVDLVNIIPKLLTRSSTHAAVNGVDEGRIKKWNLLNMKTAN